MNALPYSNIHINNKKGAKEIVANLYERAKNVSAPDAVTLTSIFILCALPMVTAGIVDTPTYVPTYPPTSTTTDGSILNTRAVQTAISVGTFVLLCMAGVAIYCLYRHDGCRSQTRSYLIHEGNTSNSDERFTVNYSEDDTPFALTPSPSLKRSHELSNFEARAAINEITEESLDEHFR